MLCARTHLLFWAASLASLLPAILRERYKHHLPDTLGDPLLEHAVSGLLLSFTWRRRRPRYLNLLYWASLFCICVDAHGAATGMGFLGEMPSSLIGVDEDGMRMLAAHVLAAFTILGTLEPIRQDRRDVEVCGMALVCMYPLRQGKTQSPVRMTIVGLLSLAIVIGVIELSLQQLLGHPVHLSKFWFPEQLTVRQLFIHAWMLSPFLDIAETIIYSASRVLFPVWYQSQARAIHNQR